MRNLWKSVGRCAPFGLVLTLPLMSPLGCGERVEGIRIDGSSTVYPISEAVAEEFRRESPGVRVTVGASGTGGGMKKFSAGEIEICDASREMKAGERQACEEAGIGFFRLSVAFDGIAVVTSTSNDWCESLTVEQLQSIWRPDNPVSTWSELNAEWPDEKIKLYGPGTNSGTFDYFTLAIVGEEDACRADFMASEDDNVLVTGVSQDTYSLGYFGFAYYDENKDSLKLIAIEQEDGTLVRPSRETVRDNSYRPLSRPLFIYVRESLLAQPSGKAFVDFYVDRTGELAAEVGYIPVSDDVQRENLAAVEANAGEGS